MRIRRLRSDTWALVRLRAENNWDATLAAAFIASCMVVGAVIGVVVSLVRQLLEACHA